MSFEVDCGTEEACLSCPMFELLPERAQVLGRLAACFAGGGAVPRNKPIERVSELIGTEVSQIEIIAIKNAAMYMSLPDICKVKET